MSYSISTIAQAINSRNIFRDEHRAPSVLAFDSRRLSDVNKTLFFALVGRRDGHDFVVEAYNEGVRNFVISEERDFAHSCPEANFLIVTDVLTAFQSLAAYHRGQFTYPVIGITGSNGKTIIKEWLYQLLAPEHIIARSPKSYNSQIGVPFSVWGMNERCDMAIIEAGVSEMGEMDSLETILRPSIGVLTNIGPAHSEGFSSLSAKIEEKLKLFKHSDILVYNPEYLKEYKGDVPGKQQFTWGWHGDVDLKIGASEMSADKKSQLLRGVYQQKEVQCMVPFSDGASVENAVCCWATLLAMGYHSELAVSRIERLHSVSMRLELKTGINNCSIIDDSYSLDLSSLAIALDFLKLQNQHPGRTIILSDFPEVVGDSASLYEQVAKLIESKDVYRLIGIGPEITAHSSYFGIDSTFFPDTQHFLAALDRLELEDETILLKGARRFEFEKISKALTQKVHETVLEINLNALEHNLNYYKSLLSPGVKMITMVKAFSYGSGSFEIANLLQFNKVDCLAVAYADEGVSLREAGITLPILVLNPDVAALDTIIDNDLEPEIFSLRVLRDFTAALRRKGRQQYPIHIKLDTGMHRSGFMREELSGLLQELKSSEIVKVSSVFSHLTSSEDPLDDDATSSQISLFKNMTRLIEEHLGYRFLRHIANTSAISRWPEAQFDMVRLGIGLYGIDSAYGQRNTPLDTVAVLKSTISQIKHLRKGETVGYNRRGVMQRDGKIATVKIGYADGYSRKFGLGQASMLVNGFAVPTIGNICMDMCMIDITDIEAKEGDEVIVFNDKITVNDLARIRETIPYEILTGISQRVKRVYFYE